jgi:hypothetical protein
MDDIYPWYERLSDKIVKDSGAKVTELGQDTWKEDTTDAVADANSNADEPRTITVVDENRLARMRRKQARKMRGNK